jgi:2-polyprenyl-3-methyl-5-hydroxy-6-metoxy-1,4-benzoquinol methylase
LSAPFDARAYWEERLQRSWSLAGVGYQRLGRAYNHWMYRVRERVFLRLAASLPVEWTAARVLDVGAGTGFYVALWHRLGVPQVTGVDLTETAVTRLRHTFPKDEFHQLDIGQPLGALPASLAQPFDAVSAMDVLFHIVDDDAYARAVRNIAALVKPGGWFLWSDNFVRHAGGRTVHQVNRSLAESERLVRQAGFAIHGRVPMFVLMNYPADTRSRAVRWLWTALVALPAMAVPPLGWAVGAGLYPFERWLTAVRRESPTTEIMVCRKVG